jgi:excinuclease ABC subunit B
MPLFKLNSEFQPAGDQPKAIKGLEEGLKKGMRYQTLLGVTGSGKTFTAANIIASHGKPTLVIAHNKTLAAQLAQEYREFFPDHAVHYFVSYYDYYQPEAYMPVTDTYIEKEAMINEEIDRLRHASTQALLTRRDVIIVASVSCIYGLGSPEEYKKVNMQIAKGMELSRAELIRKLIDIHFSRTNADITPGTFRALGNAVEIMPVNERLIYRIEYDGASGTSTVGTISEIDSITRALVKNVDSIFIFPAKHFVSNDEQSKLAFKTIGAELESRLKELEKARKPLEAERLKRRVKYDLALIREVGYCNGIENYSRHFSGKMPGEAPDTLLAYFPHNPDGSPDFLTIIDESHVTVPQIGGMYAGDASRKNTLIEYGFRLPSARDNRPLKFDEFEKAVGQVIFTSATPGEFERTHSMPTSKPPGQTVEQVIRPTGLVDPVIDIKPVTGKTKESGQIFDFISEAEKVIKKNERAIATTLTKKMAEDLSEYLKEKGIKAEYLHSDIKTIDRITILTEFRRGKFDCLVGVNLLREGLDLPEVSLIGILDADKEGFLRSETSLIQTIGRAARNAAGRVILYADHMTGSLDRAIKETERRRTIQTAYNTKHGITPQTIIKKIHDITDQLRSDHDKAVVELMKIDESAYAKNPKKVILQKERDMNSAVKLLDFETAAILRDEIEALKKRTLRAEKVAKAEENGAKKNKFTRIPKKPGKSVGPEKPAK